MLNTARKQLTASRDLVSTEVLYLLYLLGGKEENDFFSFPQYEQ